MGVRKSPKIQKLVVNAIRKLQDVEGSTPREIGNYISQEYDVPSTKIQRQVRLALARAVSYGILQRSKGGYYACNRDFVGCQPQAEEPTEKCGSSRRGRGHGMKRARSRKSRRRKSGMSGCAGGGKRRGKRRRGGRSSRRASRRGKRGRRGRSGGMCGSGGGKKSRRRSRRGGASKKSRRGSRRHRSRRGRSGGEKKCAPIAGGGPRGNDEDANVFAGRNGRGRARSASATEQQDRSVSSGSFDEERLREKHDDAQAVDSPENLLD